MKQLVFLLLVCISWSARSERVGEPLQHRCAAQAVAQAASLLAFHADMGPKDREMIEVDHQIQSLSFQRNPADPKQKLEVLELRGYIYKGVYRLRLLYLSDPALCVLVGQEVLGLGSPR